MLILLPLGSQRADCFHWSFCPTPAGVFIVKFFCFFFFHPKPFSLQDPNIPSWFKNYTSAMFSFPPHGQAALEGQALSSTTVSSVCVSVSFREGSVVSVHASSLCRSIRFFTSVVSSLVSNTGVPLVTSSRKLGRRVKHCHGHPQS